MRSFLLASAACAALVSISGQAWSADDEAIQDSTQRKEDETIVVTGARGSLNQKTESGALGDKSILDTPFSITSVNAEDIAKRQPLSIAQLFVNDPSVFSFASAGTVNWWGTQIRGLGVRNYYIDDVPLLLYWGGDYPLEAVESVQALKGATGFMYGFGAPGGAILYRTKRPTETPMLSTTVGFRGQSVFDGHVDVGGPVGDTGIGYRINVAGEQGEEYNQADITRGLASLAVDFQITPDVTWRVSGLYEDYKIEGEPFHIYWQPIEGDLPDVPSNWDYLNVDDSFYRYNLWTVATDLDWRIDADWSANLRYGFSRKMHNSNKMFIELHGEEHDDEGNITYASGDYDGYVYEFTDLTLSHVTQAMIQGKFDTGPVRHEVVAGAAYQYSRDDFGPGSRWQRAFGGNIYEPQAFLNPGPFNFEIDNGYPFQEEQTSLFISDTLYFGDDWQAIIGVRHTYYDLEDLDGDPSQASGYTTSATTPTIALLYKPAANATIYASYVESLEGGTIVGSDYVNFGDVLNATVSKQYEAGAKYESAQLSLTAAIFRVDRANQIDDIQDGLKYLTQDGRTVYDGIELIARWRVDDDLTLGLGAVFLDAEIDKVSPTNADLKGKRPAEAYDRQFVASIEYDMPPVPGLSVHAEVRYAGDTPVSDDNEMIIPAYTLVSAGLSYDLTIEGREVTIVANLNNVLDEAYWGLQNFGEPINGSIALTVDW